MLYDLNTVYGYFENISIMDVKSQSENLFHLLYSEVYFWSNNIENINSAVFLIQDSNSSIDNCSFKYYENTTEMISSSLISFINLSKYMVINISNSTFKGFLCQANGTVIFLYYEYKFFIFE